MNGKEKKVDLQLDIECDLNLNYRDEIEFAKNENMQIESDRENKNLDISFQNQDANKSSLPLNPALENFDSIMSEESINKIEIKPAFKLDLLSNQDYKLENAIRDKIIENSFSEISSDSKKSQSPSQENALFAGKEKKTSTKSYENPGQNVKNKNYSFLISFN